MTSSLSALEQLGDHLASLGWVRRLLVGGSLATGDYAAFVSDLDLVAIVDGPVDLVRQDALTTIHQQLDVGVASGPDLGCVYADAAQLLDRSALHPTWTHGHLVQRILSGVSRAELVRHGYAVFGPAPRDVLPPMNDDDLREAARAELAGYWAWAARRPWIWLDPVMQDLGLTSMARGRHTLTHGQLLTKSAAIERAAAPSWLVEQLRARRQGEPVTSPRLRAAIIAWRDARRTVALVQRGGPASDGH